MNEQAFKEFHPVAKKTYNKRRRPPKSFVRNQIIHDHKTWLEVEVWPGILIKLDSADYNDVSKINWHVGFKKEVGWMVRNSTYINGQSGNITLQKFLLKPGPGLFPTFLNREDRLDFRRSNLAALDLLTRNLKQGKRRTPTSSIYRGVTFDKAQRVWRASIEFGGKYVGLGSFKSEVDAALAYNEASQKFYGDNGFQNDTINVRRNSKDEK